jgi:hypothetical protein
MQFNIVVYILLDGTEIAHIRYGIQSKRFVCDINPEKIKYTVSSLALSLPYEMLSNRKLLEKNSVKD